MKSNKKIIWIIASALICSLIFSSMISCKGNGDISNNDIVLLGDPVNSIFKESLKSQTLDINKYQNSSAEPTKKISLGNNDLREVSYVQSEKSYRTDVNVYNAADESISCRFSAETGKLVQISAKNNSIKVPDNLLTEADYRAWVEQLLAVYGFKDISAYRYSVQTQVVVSAENSAYSDMTDSFYTDVKSNETIAMRIFTYTKYIGEYPTTDRIMFAISYLTDTIIIKFDENKLADYSKAAFDEKSVDEAVTAYINNSVDTEHYEVKAVNITDKTLTSIDGNVCMIVSVKVTLQWTNNTEPINTLLELLVY